MAAAVRAARRVVCVTATRGELGSTDPDRWPPGAQLADLRTKELAACLGEIGVTEHIWLDYPDGGCDQIPDETAVARLRSIVDAVRPDTMLTFGPDGSTYHPDHMAVSRWASAAVAGSIHAVLDGELLDMKYRAMLRQESQVGPLLALTGPDNFRALLAEETFCLPSDFPAV